MLAELPQATLITEVYSQLSIDFFLISVLMPLGLKNVIPIIVHMLMLLQSPSTLPVEGFLSMLLKPFPYHSYYAQLRKSFPNLVIELHVTFVLRQLFHTFLHHVS